MNQRLPLVLGIDGGATFSFAVASTLAGEVLATAQSCSMNFFGSSVAEARRSLNDLIHSIELQLPLGYELMQAVVGSAALFAEGTSAQKETLCRGLLPLERTRLVSDSMTAYHGACRDEPGVLIISGTGSIVVACNEAGQFWQTGGWGHILGDEGSAYWIALESVKAAIAAVEGLGPATSLVALVSRWFEVKDLTEIIPIFYHPGFSREKCAALAGFLAQHAQSDDAVFQEICRRAGQILARQALAGIRLSGLSRQPIPIYLSGGVLKKNPLVRESLEAGLGERVQFQLTEPKLTALLGAATLALSAAGISVTPNLARTLAASYHSFVADRTRRLGRR